MLSAMLCRLLLILVVLLLAAAGCPDHRPAAPRDRASVELTLWHTFNREETSTLNEIVAGVARSNPQWRIRPTVIPFGHAQNAFRRAALSCDANAPDIFRAELPWVPEFVSKGLLRPLPAGLVAESELLPVARDTARYLGKRLALPTSLDCLALIYDRRLVAKPPKSIDELLAVSRRLTIDHAGRNRTDPRFDPSNVQRWGIYVRADAYWFLPFLWAAGAELLDPSAKRIWIDDRRAVGALELYRDLIDRYGVAPRPSPSNDYEDQLQRFVSGEVAMMINGPWAMAAVHASGRYRKRSRIGVAPLPAAPLSGHGYVVSRCSKHPQQAWRLARALNDDKAQLRFARSNLLLPTLAEVARSPAVTHNRLLAAFQSALSTARGRPKHPAMARIFDDFTPAVQAAILGEATAAEALAGVARSWRRLLGVAEPAAPGGDK